MNEIKSEWIKYSEYINLLQTFDATPNLYQKNDWLDLIRDGFNCELRFIKTSYNSEIYALTPLIYNKKGPFKMIGSPLRGFFTEFIGILFKNDVSNELIQKIINSQYLLMSGNFDYIEFVNKSSTNIEIISNAFNSLNLEEVLKPSLLINIDINKDDLWKSFTGRARNMVRKAQKSDIEVNDIRPSIDWIDEYYDLLIETFKKQNLRPPHPKSFYLQVKNLYEKRSAIFIEVIYKQKMIAASIFLLDDKRMMYLSGVSDREGMRYAATSLIQWHAMKIALNLNISRYDMGGLGVKSIDKFKKSFGGEEIYHHKWTYRSKFFKFLEPIALWLAKKGFLRMG